MALITSRCGTLTLLVARVSRWFISVSNGVGKVSALSALRLLVTESAALSALMGIGYISLAS